MSEEMELTLPIACAPDTPAQMGRAGLDRGKLTAGGLAFILLTVGVFWYQFHRIQAGDNGPTWDQLQWRYLGLILLCLPIETLCASLRIRLLCRVLHPGLSFWSCIKAEWANVLASALTPAQLGGGMAQIYILSRVGLSVGTGLAISLISFMGTMVALVFMGLYSLLGLGGQSISPFFAVAFWTVILVALAIILGALCPTPARLALGTLSRMIWRLRGRRGNLQDWWLPGEERSGAPVDRMGRHSAGLANIIYAYRDEVARFLRLGKLSFLWVFLFNLAFLLSRCLMSYLCIRFLGLQTSTLGHITEVQTALTFLIFFAPTPGGAGLAESASLSMMAEIVPGGFAPYYNLLWRASTLYLAAIAGLFCLLHALVQDAQRHSLFRSKKIILEEVP